jgi:hypothetical protein
MIAAGRDRAPPLAAAAHFLSMPAFLPAPRRSPATGGIRDFRLVFSKRRESNYLIARRAEFNPELFIE